MEKTTKQNLKEVLDIMNDINEHIKKHSIMSERTYLAIVKKYD